MGKHIFVNNEGEFDDKPSGPDPLIEKIKNFILMHYEPVQDPSQADTYMSTDELMTSILRIYPTQNFTADQLALWLHEKGFTFFDAGKMRFEWLFKTVS